MSVSFDKNKLINAVRIGAAKGVALAAVKLQGNIKNILQQKSSNFAAGGIPSEPGEAPAMGTGKLVRSIKAIPSSQSTVDKPAWRVGSNLIYSRIQELGGTITAKKGKYLAVPIGLDGRRAARNSNGNLRSLNLVLIRVKGKALLWGPVGGGARQIGIKGKTLIPLFVLKHSVKMPARPYFRPAIKIFGPQLQNIIRNSVNAELKAVA